MSISAGIPTRKPFAHVAVMRAFQFVTVLLLWWLWAGAALAQTTSGNATTGQTLWTANCASCHGATPATARFNAANAGGVIAWANTANSMGMGGLTAANRNDIAAYIATLVADPNPSNQAIAHNTATAFSIPNFTLGASNAFTSLEVVSGPSKGNVSFSGLTATYTPTAGQTGADSFTFRATGAAGTSNTRTVTLSIANPPPPAITSGGAASGTTGTAMSYQISASNSPTSYNASGLPPGLSVNTGTGLISGTPSATGSYGATVYATNAGGTGSRAVTFSISLGAPVITSGLTASGATSSAFGPYQITATNSPTSFNATGLPAGLTVNTATGLISGTPTASGTFNVDISATNATATDTERLVITISLSAPVINSALTAGGATNVAFGPYQITATNSPTSFNATGLPAGLAVDAATGVISGTPTASGTFNATISATNATATDSKTLEITISLSAPAITSASSASGTSGQSFSYQITALNSPASYSATGLPAGLSINTATGLISGTPAGGGTTVATIGATNATGSATMSLTLNIAYVAPGVQAASVSTAFNTALAINLPVSGDFTQLTVGTPGHGTVTAPGPGVTSVTYTPATGYSGADSFTYTATGPGGTSVAATVTITVGTLAPTAGVTTMTVTLNTAATLDLAPFITGSSISGVSITTAPAHGAVIVNGTKVTYTPANNYFGDDTFAYAAYGNAGTSAPATVAVTVTGRPDPTKDAAVTAMVASQVDAARRFSRAQISNFQGRMESLHRRGRSGEGVTAGFDARADGRQAAAPAPSGTAGAAYRPAASLGADPAAGLHANTQTSTAALATLASAVTAASGSANEPAGLAARALALAANSAQGGSLNLNAATNATGQAGAGTTDVWVGGSIRFGHRDPESNNGYRFTSDGISIGVDRRLSEDWVAGVGVGIGRDSTEIGTDGTNSRGKSTAIAVYGSYQPTDNVYLDGVVGAGQIDYSTERYVAPANDVARSDRKGDFLFGSLTAGYEFQAQGLRISPYGRLDVARHRLRTGTETGAGAYALVYGEQEIPSLQLSAGLRTESAHEARFGWVLPRLRVEFQHEFKGEEQASFAYADLPGGPVYLMPANSSRRNALVLGAGADLLVGRNLRFSLDYQLQRASGAENAQAVFVKLTRQFGNSAGHGLPASSFVAGSLGLKIDASVMFDDNVTRASTAAERYTDSAYGVNLAKSLLVASSEKTRLFLNATAGAEQFRHYGGLSHIHAGADVEWQYRASGDFDSPIWALFGNVSATNFASNLRDGHKLGIGLSLRQALTDRLALFGAVAHNRRHARSKVFDGSDYSARVNLDYALAPAATLYLGGDYRVGDIVSTGRHTLANVNIADWFMADDAFARNRLYAYRFDGRTMIVTLGYNHALGTKDSFDISWRHAMSTPFDSPGLPGVKRPRYTVNQLSVMYLTSF